MWKEIKQLLLDTTDTRVDKIVSNGDKETEDEKYMLSL